MTLDMVTVILLIQLVACVPFLAWFQLTVWRRFSPDNPSTPILLTLLLTVMGGYLIHAALAGGPFLDGLDTPLKSALLGTSFCCAGLICAVSGVQRYVLPRRRP